MKDNNTRLLAGRYDSDSNRGKRSTECANCRIPIRVKRITKKFCGESCGKAASRRKPNDLRKEELEPSSSFSIPVDLIGGSSRRWPGATRLDPDLRKAILDAELGGGDANDDQDLLGVRIENSRKE